MWEANSISVGFGLNTATQQTVTKLQKQTKYVAHPSVHCLGSFDLGRALQAALLQVPGDERLLLQVYVTHLPGTSKIIEM